MANANLRYAKLGFQFFISNALYLLLVPLLSIASTHLLPALTADGLFRTWDELIVWCKYNYVKLALRLVPPVLTWTLYRMTRPREVYLVNFACHKPEPSQVCSKETLLKLSAQNEGVTEESVTFVKRILERSGIGQMTYGPKSLVHTPQKLNFAGAREETEAVIIGAVDELLAKTGVNPKDIGVLVVNIGMFVPTPSWTCTVVNHYKLRGNILTYNLGGMGCSAGIISIDLAKRLLQKQPNSYALVISSENMTANWYTGNDRSMLLTNCLFRVGGAAILLSNRSSDRRRSKYQLLHTVRTHIGADDTSYKCIYQQEDEFKKVGVALSKDLTAVAGEALKRNITTLGPLVLPMSEKILYVANLAARKVLKMKIKPYAPDFKLAFEHFCIHAGGKGVLDEMEKNLELSEANMEPSRMTLYRFGNTSSSCLWYELAYSESKGRVRKGDRVWQIGFGSGFKCNSGVWRALKTINPAREQNPWTDEIDNFPVQVPTVDPLDFELVKKP